MKTAMLVEAINAAALAAAAGNGHPIPHPPPTVAALPIAGVAAWPVRRCGDGSPEPHETTAAEAIDASCVRLVVRTRAGYRRGNEQWSGAGGGGDSNAWRVAQLVLPGLQGIVGPGGFGLGLGSELQLVRGAHMTLHLAAARDTRIADTTFAPETTVLARCGACWTDSEAAGAGLINGASGGRRGPGSAAPR